MATANSLETATRIKRLSRGVSRPDFQQRHARVLPTAPVNHGCQQLGRDALPSELIPHSNVVYVKFSGDQTRDYKAGNSFGRARIAAWRLRPGDQHDHILLILQLFVVGFPSPGTQTG